MRGSRLSVAALLAGTMTLLAARTGAVSPTPPPLTATPTGRPASEAAQSLDYTVCSLASLRGRPLVGNTFISLLFKAGTLTGTAGCNRYTGEYAANEDGSLSIAGVALTKKLCPEPAGSMQQEQAYAGALGRSAAYRLVGDRLELQDSAGTLLLVFRLQPSGVHAGMPDNPRLVGALGGWTLPVVVRRSLAYLGQGPALTLLDISDPAAPAVVGRTAAFPGRVQGVVVVGSHAYLAAYTAGLLILR